MCNESILTLAYRKDIKTIVLMDKFEARDENHNYIYTALMLQNTFLILLCGMSYEVDLVIKRISIEMPRFSRGITFTSLKKTIAHKTFSSASPESPELVSSVFRALSLLPNIESDNDVLTLDEPVLFLAQSNKNRMGYGNGYRAGRTVCSGTKFGETTPYLITSVRLRKYNLEDTE